MSNPHKFDSKYTDYWEQAVKDSIDGSKIPGVNEAKFFLQGMQLNRSDKILELGCSFGRMFEAISSFSDNVYGMDPELSALVKAANKPYKSLDQGFAENTKYKNEFFDAIFCWAVFDVVDQKKGFLEMNRILKKQGKLLLTGKNSNYHLDDKLAYKAEKNARLKSFPNKFTNLKEILNNFEKFGFKLDKLYIYPQRGDFGGLNFLEYSDSQYQNECVGYEYIMLCHKISDVNFLEISTLKIDDEFSNTAYFLSKQSGFLNPDDFFKSIGID